MIIKENITNTLPKIIFEEMRGEVIIKGRSVAEESDQHFSQFLPYFYDCLQKNPMNISVDIDLEYFSTKTARILMDFFNNLRKKVDDQGFHTIINWHYDIEDEDLLEAGKDYQSVSKLHFNFLQNLERNDEQL